MIRKLLCKMGIHKPKLEVVTNTSSGKEYGCFKDDEQVHAIVCLNIKCERCDKYLDSRVIKMKFKEEQTDEIWTSFTSYAWGQKG